MYNLLVKKLDLIYANDVAIAGEKNDVVGIMDRRGTYGGLVVGSYTFIAIAHIHGWLEYFHLLLGNQSPVETSYKLFGFARKHRSTDHFYVPFIFPVMIFPY